MTNLLLIILTYLLFTQVQHPEPDPPSSPPNVIIITGDDHGIQLGSYGDSIARTPHLDKLSTQGIHFSKAFVTQASCSSSRSSILTGLYPHQNGQIGLAHRGFSMDKAYPNLVRTLKENGYRTGIVGKLHVNPSNAFPFDFSMTASNPTRDVRWVADTARWFMETGEKPFLLYLNYSDPHTKFVDQIKGIPANPIDPSQVKPFPFQMIDQPQQLSRISGYYNCVSRLDAGVGMILRELKNLGLEENSVIIYLGDHGAPFTRGKTTCYEAGVQIPLIVRYPGEVTPGTSSSALVSTIDIYPTILDILNLTTPPELQGVSLLKTMSSSASEQRAYLFSEMTYHTHLNYAPKRAVRNGRYKLIHNILFNGAKVVPSVDGDRAYAYSRDDKYDKTIIRTFFDRLTRPPEYELYDLLEDPYEFSNLANDPDLSGELDTLKQALEDWRMRTNDPFFDLDIQQEHLEMTKDDIAQERKKRK